MQKAPKPNRRKSMTNLLLLRKAAAPPGGQEGNHAGVSEYIHVEPGTAAALSSKTRQKGASILAKACREINTIK